MLSIEFTLASLLWYTLMYIGLLLVFAFAAMFSPKTEARSENLVRTAVGVAFFAGAFILIKCV